MKQLLVLLVIIILLQSQSIAIWINPNILISKHHTQKDLSEAEKNAIKESLAYQKCWDIFLITLNLIQNIDNIVYKHDRPYTIKTRAYKILQRSKNKLNTALWVKATECLLKYYDNDLTNDYFIGCFYTKTANWNKNSSFWGWLKHSNDM